MAIHDAAEYTTLKTFKLELIIRREIWKRIRDRDSAKEEGREERKKVLTR